jgi:hypothetical protein
MKWFFSQCIQKKINAQKDKKYSRDTSLAWKEEENNKVYEVH